MSDHEPDLPDWLRDQVSATAGDLAQSLSQNWLRWLSQVPRDVVDALPQAVVFRPTPPLLVALRDDDGAVTHLAGLVDGDEPTAWLGVLTGDQVALTAYQDAAVIDRAPGPRSALLPVDPSTN